MMARSPSTVPGSTVDHHGAPLDKTTPVLCNPCLSRPAHLCLDSPPPFVSPNHHSSSRGRTHEQPAKPGRNVGRRVLVLKDGRPPSIPGAGPGPAAACVAERREEGRDFAQQWRAGTCQACGQSSQVSRGEWMGWMGLVGLTPCGYFDRRRRPSGPGDGLPILRLLATGSDTLAQG